MNVNARKFMIDAPFLAIALVALSTAKMYDAEDAPPWTPYKTLVIGCIAREKIGLPSVPV